jgi:hypothetical protein
MKKLLRAAGALSIVVATPAVAEDSVLRSLPSAVQKEIAETRAACQQAMTWQEQTAANVPQDDVGLVTFTVSGKQAVLVDSILLCGGCYKGSNCSNRGTRDVWIYVLFGDVWKKVLSNGNVVGDIFVSYVPGYRPEGQQRLNALVMDLYEGNKECPTREAGSASAQSWEARSCVVRWNGRRFTYKPL